MKKTVKSILATVMALLLFVSALPATAFAQEGQEGMRIFLNLHESYLGDDLSEIFPLVKIKSYYPTTDDGRNFVVYCDTNSLEEAKSAAAMLRKYSIVARARALDEGESTEFMRVKFSVYFPNSYFGEGEFTDFHIINLEKIFHGVNISEVDMWSEGLYDFYCNVRTQEELYEIYDVLAANPFIAEREYLYNGGDGILTAGYINVVTNKKFSLSEVVDVFNEIEILNVYAREETAASFTIVLSDRSLRGTMETIPKLRAHPNVIGLGYTTSRSMPCVMPTKLEEVYFKAPERPEVTVETALQALRVTAGLSDARNGVYDYKLADAIWQFDVDGDKVITVLDALALLRVAAKV